MNWTPNVPQRAALLVGSGLLTWQWSLAVEHTDGGGLSVAMVLILAMGLLCGSLYKVKIRYDELTINISWLPPRAKTTMIIMACAAALLFARHVQTEINDLKFSVSWLERKEAKRIGLPEGLDPKYFGGPLPMVPVPE